VDAEYAAPRPALGAALPRPGTFLEVAPSGSRLLLVLPKDTRPEAAQGISRAFHDRWPDVDVFVLVGAEAVAVLPPAETP
jgi:hypothetical protein